MSREPASSVNRHVPVYPIRTLIRLADVKRHVIYAWEKHGLIKPARTEGGHRLFSEEDADLIRWIQFMADQGLSLGEIRRLIGTPMP